MENIRTGQLDVSSAERFGFGENWSRFLSVLNDERIALAQESLKEMVGVKDLEGMRFLDIGSGSGLFSLAARRLGATVYSFDFDPKSVACTQELKNRFFNGDSAWVVEAGSVLDSEYLAKLGRFDIVYSWGVLHHTGQMWRALENAESLVNGNGKLFIAIYNDQGRASRVWLKIKKTYNQLPPVLRWMVLFPSFARLWGPTMVRDLISGRPFSTWRNFKQDRSRGMSPWHDVIDWVGGLPFEVASPEAIFDFYRAKGFKLLRLKTCGGGHGCNEFVFARESAG